jgi:hypothetical protein
MLAYLAMLDIVVVLEALSYANSVASPGSGRRLCSLSLSTKNVQEREMQLPGFEPWPGPKQFLLLYPAAQSQCILA